MVKKTVVLEILELLIGYDTLQNLTPADRGCPIVPWLEVALPQYLHAHTQTFSLFCLSSMCGCTLQSSGLQLIYSP